MDNELRRRLMGISTGTLTYQLLKRNIRNVYMRGVLPLHPVTERMVGVAYTLRFIPMREDIADLALLASPQNLARRAIEECPAGGVLVTDARGDRDSGTIGDILITRLKYRGVAGIVTDGGIRDADAVRDIGLPVFGAGPAAPASPTAHCPAGLQEPISCGGVAVYPGDIIVADGDGCAVLPQALAEEVARDAAAQEGIEEFIQKLVAGGRPVIGTYPAGDTVRAEYDAWLKAGKPAL
ncbi:MAG: ribonuclease activity regulator RraA [Alphaproteobacteria bacterium]